MFKNYFKIAVRNLLLHKGYSLINIIGLSIGMMCTILILLWVQDELRYDRFHENANDLYRLVDEDNGVRYAVTHIPLVTVLKKEVPEIIKATRVDINPGMQLVEYGEKRFEQHGKFVDPDFFEMFTYSFLKGNPETAFSEPYSIVITQELSQQFFGDKEPINKVLHIDDNDYTVTGVIENIPQNSHLQFDFLRPFKLFKIWGWDFENWGDHSYYSYVLLQEKSCIKDVNQKINDCFKRHKLNATAIYSLQPLTRIHLFSDFKFDIAGNGDIIYIYIFTLIAIIIIIIACINFMNLSTARSINRAKEVGIRKIVGSKPTQLIIQFFCESIMLAFISYLFALTLVELFLPLFNGLCGKNLAIVFSDSLFTLGSIAIISFVGILAGSYPALILSSFTPLNIIRNNMIASLKGITFRKILVVIQFSFSIGLIVATGVIFNQLNFMRNTKLGFDKENLVYLEIKNDLNQNVGIIKKELLQNPDIIDVTFSSSLPIEVMMGTTSADWEGKNEDADIQMMRLITDYDFLKTYKMKVAEGRYYSEEFSTDKSEGIVLNEAAIREMKMQDPIGKRFSWEGDRRIIGVIQDFHYRSLRKKVEPLIIRLANQQLNFLTIRIRPSHCKFTGLIEFLESKWKKYTDDYPFELHFLDDTLDSLYYAEQQMSKIFLYFTSLSIFIACLGLFGLASFSTEQRTKEIGIRKVLGATAPEVVVLLSKEFLKWVLIANIIAWPTSWYVMTKWLQNFTYKTSISIWYFLIAGVLSMLIALSTVSVQSIRAANGNPINALKYE